MSGLALCSPGGGAQSMEPGSLGTATGLLSVVEVQGQKAGDGGCHARTQPLFICGNATRGRIGLTGR